MPTTRNPRTLTPADEKPLSAALTRRIGPTVLPHTYRHVVDPLSSCLFKVWDPETGSHLMAQMLPGYRMLVISFYDGTAS